MSVIDARGRAAACAFRDATKGAFVTSSFASTDITCFSPPDFFTYFNSNCFCFSGSSSLPSFLRFSLGCLSFLFLDFENAVLPSGVYCQENNSSHYSCLSCINSFGVCQWRSTPVFLFPLLKSIADI